ncbi:hypothetical protein ACVMIH_000069 [Bradyrhizobium sp. USDA 4503]
MTRTYYQDFVKDDGTHVTVEYTYKPGSDTTYSPMNGACGGDPCEVSVGDSWPRSDEYDRFHGRLTALEAVEMGFRSAHWYEEKAELEAKIAEGDKLAELSDAERLRMENWLIENHKYDPEEYEDQNGF